MRYGYSIKPDKVDNMYNFDVKLYTTGGLGVRISTEIGDFYKEPLVLVNRLQKK